MLAAGLGVSESALASTVTAIRAALPGRVPGGPHDLAAIRARLAADAPAELERVEGQAGLARDRVFDLLGSGPVSLGPRIDWHCDFKSGYRWDPRRHYSRIRFGNRAGVDVKVPWELSRGHHLVLLAQAARLTDRPELAREAVDQILDWIDQNPPEFGVNWTGPMDVAIRAVNWLWTAALLAPLHSIDDRCFATILGSLLAHGRFLERNLEVSAGGFRTNHYIANLVGLLYLGCCVPELDDAGRWRSLAHDELAAEMQHQVLPDGASYESSIPYHRLVAELFVSALLVGRTNGVEFDSAFKERLSRMIDFTAAYTKPNGLAPQIGDADDGRLHVLSGFGGDARDHRHVLAAGAVAFERRDWLAAAGDRWVEALWLGGANACARLQDGTAPVPRSAAFEQAGIYILRDGQDFVCVSAGPVGTDGMGNHKHNDVLSIEVNLGGEDVLIDPGTFVYTPDPGARNAFRSTAAHSTVIVDGLEQNRIRPSWLFRLTPDATPRLVSWEPSPDGGSVAAEHDGYVRRSGVTHRRRVTLAAHLVAIEDVLTGAPGTAHTAAWTFAFAPACSVQEDRRGWVIATARQRFELTWPVDDRGEQLTLETRCEDGDVSASYGRRERSRIVRWVWRGPLPATARFDLKPA